KKTIFTLVTVLVIAGVLLCNIGFHALATRGLWFLDFAIPRYLSMEGTLYKVSDSCIDLLEKNLPNAVDAVNAERAAKGEEPLKVEIIFCTDPDVLDDNDYTRYIHYTALGLQKEFPDYVDVQYVNIVKNPSAIQRFKATSATNIYSSNVIVSFGTEYRVFTVDSLFTSNDATSNDYWAYNGEKKLTSGILAVTRAESPIACLTVNHGEKIEGYHEFKRLIEAAGYEVQTLDLEQDAIPENCRLIITMAPQYDFYGDANDDNDEIDKLDAFLDKAYSFLYVCDPDSPTLPNLEEYLEFWGIKQARKTDSAGFSENYLLQDAEANVDGEGFALIGTYATLGTGASFTGDLRKNGYPPTVIFDHASAIKPADNYKPTYVLEDETTNTEAYMYHSYRSNGITRTMHNIFTAPATANGTVNGEVHEAAGQYPFSIMTLTVENRTTQETNYSVAQEPSYVCCIASTEFLSDTVLASDAYGNADVVLGTLRYMGREVIPVTLEFKAFLVWDIAEAVMASRNPMPVMIVLAVVPALVCFGVGIFFNVRRKYL
ncbi:MAG: Gldg family protein, partial [Clostridia bacterium]|nr:Gldg family protein [Clostridia bacterium]